MISALVDHLASFYQSGNMAQVEVISRSILTAIPEDIVALQFLGLALYRMGRIEDARRTFRRLASMPEQTVECGSRNGCEPAHCATFRAATQPHSGLADGWHRIGLALIEFGFHNPARRAFAAAFAASGSTLSKLRRSTDIAKISKLGRNKQSREYKLHGTKSDSITAQ
jgi:hypothetical protein